MFSNAQANEVLNIIIDLRAAELEWKYWIEIDGTYGSQVHNEISYVHYQDSTEEVLGGSPMKTQVAAHIK